MGTSDFVDDTAETERADKRDKRYAFSTEYLLQSMTWEFCLIKTEAIVENITGLSGKFCIVYVHK